MPSWLHRWLSEGYSVRLDKNSFGAQPGLNRLKSAENEFVTKAINDWMCMGCCEEVPIDKVHHKAIVCNVLVAYRNTEMERVCWSGKAINLGVDDKSFKMEQLEDIMNMSKAGPALLIRIRMNTVSVSNTPYCVLQPYLPYVTVGKYGFCSKIRISQNPY